MINTDLISDFSCVATEVSLGGGAAIRGDAPFEVFERKREAKGCATHYATYVCSDA
jgi:hypothetical protein